MLRRPPEVAATDARSSGEASESWLLRTGLSFTVWSLAAVATVLAATGQVEFARWAGITDIRAYAVPAVLELVAVAFLLIGYRRARHGDSPGGLWTLAAGVGAFAVYTNVVHAGGRAGLVYGAASAITLVLWFVKLRDDYRKFQRQTGQATRPRPKFGTLWLVAPRLTLRAWVIATRRRISVVDDAVGYAEVWRAVYEDARSARVGRRLARRTAWRSVAEVAGGVITELPRTAEIAAVQVMRRSADAGPAAPSAPAPVSTSPVEPAGTVAPTPAAPTSPAPGPTSPAPASGPAPTGPAEPLEHAADPGPTQPPESEVSWSVEPSRSVATRPAQPSLRERVFAFLDQHAGPEVDIDESDEPYLSWSVAGALGVSPDAVAPHVRAWRRGLTGGHDAPVSPASVARVNDGYLMR